MRRILKWGAVASLTGAAVLALDALFFEKYFFEVNTFRIGSNKAKGKKIKILLLSDLHFKQHYWPYYGKLARTVNELQPDLIFITGDTLDGHSSATVVDKFFSQINHGIPKVAIPGNHDYIDDMPLDSLQALYHKHNCQLLRNKTIAMELKGERVVVTGLDDFIESESCFLQAVAETAREEHHFLLIHSPLQQEPVLARLEELNSKRAPEERLNIGYIFAGHNHGGQVRFGNIVPKLPTMSGRYVNGWYNTEQPYLYLSKGFGTSTLPFRFGARSEVALFEYHF